MDRKIKINVNHTNDTMKKSQKDFLSRKWNFNIGNKVTRFKDFTLQRHSWYEVLYLN